MGKRASAPPAPDYAGAARAQGAANVEAARASAMLSNPNIIGPLGTQTVTYGNEVFDEAAYNRAMETYQSRGGRGEMPTEAQFTVQNQETGAYNLDQPGYMRALAQWAVAGGAAPTREQFTTRTNLDIPTVRQTLTPEAQATLEAQQRVDRQLAQLGEQGIGTAQRALSTPFTPNLPPVRTDLGLYGDVARAPDITGMGMARGGPTAPSLQAGLGYTGEILGAPDLTAAGIARGGVRAPRLQGRLEPVGGPVRGVSLTGLGQAETDVLAPSLRSNIDLTGLAAMPVGAGATAQQAILARLEPSLTRSRAALENQLVNQGIPRGSEAYRAAMTEQSQQENDLRSQAALQGLNLDMAARQQGLSESTGLASFANQAQLAGFGAQMQRQQAANQALAQNQAALAQQAQIENAAQQQAFNQAVASGQFGNAAQLASFGAGLQNQQAYNQAVAQNQAMLAQQQQMQNAAQQQAFNQALASGQFGNQAQLAAFGAGMQSTEAANQALAQNQAAALQQQQAANAAQTQAFNQALSAAQFGNTAQQQALQQQLLLRAQPLNEIIGLMGGSQIQMPQFGGYQPTQVTPAPIFGAAQAAGQNAMQQYGIQQAGINAQMQGLGMLAGSALRYAPAAITAWSDRRLKSNIVRVGDHPLGIGIYEYDIFGNRERGVMAQEVLEVKPEAVHMMPNGFMAVNYGAL
jgi:hypothetical protein